MPLTAAIRLWQTQEKMKAPEISWSEAETRQVNNLNF